jgi:FkbM family methyltransferase
VRLNCPKGNVILVNKAISDRKGKGMIKVPKLGNKTFSGRASMLNKSYHYEQARTYMIEMDTLDNIVSSLGIRKIDLLKIDIEGAEVFAFKGMKKTLEITDKLMIEIQPGNEWLIDELVKIGFKLVDRKGMNYFFVRTS